MTRPTITRGATLRIPAQFADGYFAGWVPTSQLRTHADTLIASLDAQWVDAATTRILQLSADNTASWPIGLALFDVCLTSPGGVTVGTTIDDQNRITSVIANAQLAGVDSVDFKAQSGWTTLSLEHMRGIAAAIALHVQACFSAERAHHEAINAASGAELYGYDINARWPSNGV